jgi:transcriptional regulator with XRE-family HTH domain
MARSKGKGRNYDLSHHDALASLLKTMRGPLSCRGLAEITGISASQISRIERGECEVHFAEVKAVQKAVGNTLTRNAITRLLFDESPVSPVYTVTDVRQLLAVIASCGEDVSEEDVTRIIDTQRHFEHLLSEELIVAMIRQWRKV